MSAYAEAAAGGVVDLLIGVPAPTAEQAEKYQQLPARRSATGRARRTSRSPRSTCSRTCRSSQDLDDPVEALIAEMDTYGIRRGDVERRHEPRRASRGPRAPGPLHRELGRRPEPRHGGDPRARAGRRAARRAAPHRSSRPGSPRRCRSTTRSSTRSTRSASSSTSRSSSNAGVPGPARADSRRRTSR